MSPPPRQTGERGLLDGALRCVGTTMARFPRVLPSSLQWRSGFQTLSFQNPHRPPLNQNRSRASQLCPQISQGRRCQPSHVFCASRVLCGQPTIGPSRPQSSPAKARKPSASSGGRDAFQRTSRPPFRAEARIGDSQKANPKRLAADARDGRGGGRVPGHPAACQGRPNKQRHPPMRSKPANPQAASHSPLTLKSCQVPFVHDVLSQGPRDSFSQSRLRRFPMFPFATTRTPLLKLD